MIWYVRVITVENGDFSTCVEAENEEEAREKAMQQVRWKYLPNLAWAKTEILDPKPEGKRKKN